MTSQTKGKFIWCVPVDSRSQAHAIKVPRPSFDSFWIGCPYFLFFMTSSVIETCFYYFSIPCFHADKQQAKISPIWGCLIACLVLGYWQATVHSHCSLIRLLWFHKQRVNDLYTSLREGKSPCCWTGWQASWHTAARFLICSMIKGLPPRSYFYALPGLQGFLVRKGQCMGGYSPV